MLTVTKTPIAKFNENAVFGHVVRVGRDEKRKAENVITVFDGREYIHYVMFHKGLENLLYSVCTMIAKLINSPMVEPGEYKALMIALVNALWIVDHKSTATRHSKLDGIKSLSTCCMNNRFCLARMKDKDSICSHCYAATQQSIQFGLTEHNIINGVILQNVGIPMWAWQSALAGKLYGEKVFRIESFGDIANMMQACNYITLAKAFPQINFAAWSKNVAMWLAAFDTIGKPGNLSFVSSSYRVNEKDKYSDNRINHSFTVYDKDTIAEKRIAINCGGRRCMDCIINHVGCYFTDTAAEIREELK